MQRQEGSNILDEGNKVRQSLLCVCNSQRYFPARYIRLELMYFSQELYIGSNCITVPGLSFVPVTWKQIRSIYKTQFLLGLTAKWRKLKNSAAVCYKRARFSEALKNSVSWADISVICSKSIFSSPPAEDWACGITFPFSKRWCACSSRRIWIHLIPYKCLLLTWHCARLVECVEWLQTTQMEHTRRPRRRCKCMRCARIWAATPQARVLEADLWLRL